MANPANPAAPATPTVVPPSANNRLGSVAKSRKFWLIVALVFIVVGLGWPYHSQIYQTCRSWFSSGQSAQSQQVVTMAAPQWLSDELLNNRKVDADQTRKLTQTAAIIEALGASTDKNTGDIAEIKAVLATASNQIGSNARTIGNMLTASAAGRKGNVNFSPNIVIPNRVDVRDNGVRAYIMALYSRMVSDNVLAALTANKNTSPGALRQWMDYDVELKATKDALSRSKVGVNPDDMSEINANPGKFFPSAGILETPAAAAQEKLRLILNGNGDTQSSVNPPSTSQPPATVGGGTSTGTSTEANGGGGRINVIVVQPPPSATNNGNSAAQYVLSETLEGSRLNGFNLPGNTDVSVTTAVKVECYTNTASGRLKFVLYFPGNRSVTIIETASGQFVRL